MNYEIAYKEALARAENINGEWSSPEAVAEYIFPEIKKKDINKLTDHKHTIDKIFGCQPFVVVINETTGNSFRARSVKYNRGDIKLNYQSVIIEAENINDTIPVIGKKIIDNTTIITKKEAIGNNKRLKILHCKHDNTIIYEALICNAWIKEISEEDNIIVLDCDYIG